MTQLPRIAPPPCLAPGSPGPLQATGRPLRWGVVSTGAIATLVSEDLARLADAVLQAVSSRNHANAVAFQRRFGFATAYFDGDAGAGYDQLFADPEVDVVYVATPHGQHYGIARRALEAGKHVLCEKSLTINAREALELTELAADRGLFLMEAVWTRFLPIINRAWEVLASGELGEVRWVQADLGFSCRLRPGSPALEPRRRRRCAAGPGRLSADLGAGNAGLPADGLRHRPGQR